MRPGFPLGRGVIAGVLLLGAGVGGGCSSVELPAERFFVLAVAGSPDSHPSAGEPVVDTLRVLDLVPASTVDRDHPVWRRGHEVQRPVHDRWLAPLDRLVTDGLRQGLARHGVAGLVKGAIDAGGDDWQLHGRILEFAVADVAIENGSFPGSGRGSGVVATGPVATIRMELWLTAGGERRFRHEFGETEPLDAAADDPVAAAVTAFGRAFDRLIEQVAWRLRALPPANAGPGTSPGR
ncbi:MAG: ABC-type transport auxiliary lipoprotein family protein [bacterium]|nr:ABC-type transport auxiliary lipoprotein family protein [bacterium]